jgi:hypothetical protein|tara:strand:+ start:308 stop:1165 length:858 start_codon:yes stop_codon:yes gene_type:complete
LVSVNYSLIGANSDSITFDYLNYILNPGFMGFNVPAAEVRIENSAGDGGVFRHAKRGVRTMDIPITVVGSSRDDVQAKLRRLGKLTQNVFGPLTLRASYSDGTSLELKSYYTGGAEGQWGSNAGQTYATWTLSLKAPQPYWQSTTVEQFTVTRGATGRGLLPQLTKLRISSSQALGAILINNTGDVPMFPTYKVLGPIDNLLIRSGTGEAFSFNANLAAGEIININTETGEVTNAAGVNRYDILNPAPKLFRIPVGESTVFIEGINVDEDTRVDLFYALRFEVVH